MPSANYYDRIAQIYDRSRWLSPEIAAAVADFILDLVGATRATSFLEPGIGTGLNVVPLVERGYAVTGIDISSEMLACCRQKFRTPPPNLTLICGDASQLPFADNSFDVILTVHMVHTVTHWQRFLGEIDRALKPGGFYLNAQWLMPPARREFEGHFRKILAAYDRGTIATVEAAIADIAIDEFFACRGYQSQYHLAQTWTVHDTLADLLADYRARAYGLCWQLPESAFQQALKDFEVFCQRHYDSLQIEFASLAKFEIWSYTSR